LVPGSEGDSPLAADYIDEILKALSPLPSPAASQVRTCRRWKPTNALGLTVPQVILGRADEVIE
jgi:hypothetical protein